MTESLLLVQIDEGPGQSHLSQTETKDKKKKEIQFSKVSAALFVRTSWEF